MKQVKMVIGTNYFDECGYESDYDDWVFFKNKIFLCVYFGCTCTKIATIQRLAWSLCKIDMQIHELFYIFAMIVNNITLCI